MSNHTQTNNTYIYSRGSLTSTRSQLHNCQGVAACIPPPPSATAAAAAAAASWSFKGFVNKINASFACGEPQRALCGSVPRVPPRESTASGPRQAESHANLEVRPPANSSSALRKALCRNYYCGVYYCGVFWAILRYFHLSLSPCWLQGCLLSPATAASLALER